MRRLQRIVGKTAGAEVACREHRPTRIVRTDQFQPQPACFGKPARLAVKAGRVSRAKVGPAPFGIGKTVAHGMRAKIEGKRTDPQKQPPLMQMILVNRPDSQARMGAKHTMEGQRGIRAEVDAVGDDRAGVVGDAEKGMFNRTRLITASAPDQRDDQLQLAICVPARHDKWVGVMCWRDVSIEGRKPVRMLEGRCRCVPEQPVKLGRTEIEAVGGREEQPLGRFRIAPGLEVKHASIP